MSDRSDAISVLHVLSGKEVGGIQKVLFALIDELRVAGVDITLLVLEEGILVERAKGHGIRVSTLSRKPGERFRTLWKVMQYLQQERFDLVHTHSISSNFHIRMSRYLLGKDIHIVTTIHADTHSLLQRVFAFSMVGKMVSWIDLRMSDLSDRLIVVSQDIKDKLLKRIRIDETKVTVIRNGVRTSGVRLKYEERNKAIESLGCQTGDKIVGAVGRLTEEKNHVMLLMAAQVVVTKHPNAKFLIVGDGPLREELENLAAELLISDNTIFAGWRDDVNTLYQVMDLVVFPSLTEGLPISLLEAMSHGKVVLATRAGGIPEVIHHGKNGVLIDENDPEYLAEGITYILKNASKVQEMGRRASELIEKELSIGRMAEETRMVYREVLGC